MPKSLKFILALLLALGLRASAQGTAFTYQGQLANGGNPVTGNFDFQFSVFDNGTNGNQISPYVTNAPVGVTNGLFTTVVDVGGGVFTGPDRWLSLGVRTNGATGTAYTLLLPRQKLTATPYAIFAGGASNLLGALAATQLAGTVSAAQISGNYTGAVTFSSVSNTFAGAFNGAFTGNGASLTNLNGSAIATGTVADARLTTNVALLNANQTFSGANTFTNWNNSFTGSFYGNGLVGWNTVAGTTLAAVIDHGYVLTNAQLVSVTLPAANAGDIIRLSGPGAGGWQINLTNGQSILGSFPSYNSQIWNPSSSAGVGNWESIASSSDGSRLISAIYGGGVYTSSDYGVTWSQVSGLLTSAQWRSVAISANGSKLMAAVNGGYIYTNSGVGWAATYGPFNWSSVACSADGTRQVGVVYGGGVYVSANSGVNWAQQTAGLPNSGVGNWISVDCSANGNNLVLAVLGGYIYVSSNGGTNWSQSGASSLNWESVASSADGTRLVAAAQNGGVYVSTNSGTSWTQQSGVPTSNVYGVAASADASKLAAVVAGGGIYLSGNLGNNWSQQTSAPSTNWFAVTISADGNHLAAAANGTAPSAGPIYISQTSPQSLTATYTNNLFGSQGAAVELQCIGSGRFMPVSSAGPLWGY